MTLGSNSPLAGVLEYFGGGSIAFTFSGLVVGSVIYSLPFVVQPLQNSFSAVRSESLEVAATLGASNIDRFFTVAVPLARSGFVTAAVLGFAHTVGEFGVVLMIGGNIPGETGVLSIAIYDHVEAMEYSQAHLLAGGLLVASFVMLIFVYLFNRHFSLLRSRDW
jgi:molybdate transport system permease protein